MSIVAEYTILNRSGLKSDNPISCGLSQQTQCDDNWYRSACHLKRDYPFEDIIIQKQNI
jgi:hypothetical protein